MAAPDQPDPLTGNWTLNLSKSTLNVPPPRFWVQHIQSNEHELSLREEIISADGLPMTVSLRAAFDGKDYPVTGSHYVDTIAYSRLDARTLSAVGKQQGSVFLRESITVSPEGDTLSLALTVFSGDHQIAAGTLVFVKS
jgi:hypothetical protein